MISSITSNPEPGARSANMIPLCVPEVRGNEWAYIKECLDTGWVSSVGPFVDRFERETAALIGTDFAIATASGTAALHVALMVAGVQAEDEVLISDLSFIAPANAIRYIGAWPVFIDAEPRYWQMDIAKVADFLQNQCTWKDGILCNKVTGRRVSAILPVHVLGHPVDIEPLRAMASTYNLPIVEDATEGLGAFYKDKRVGSGGQIACLSYNGNKIITTGGGGMIVTDNPEWAKRAKYLTTQAKDDPFEYIHSEVGYNYRLTNIQAAMGCAQLELLDEYVAKKRDIAKRYGEGLADIPGLTPMREAPWAFSTYWMYTVLVDEAHYGKSSRALMRYLGQNGVQARPLWHPLHRNPVFANIGTFDCPVADHLNQIAISLPCSVGLSDDEQKQVIALLQAGAD